MHVLVIEDEDFKYQEIDEILEQTVGVSDVERAKTVNRAEELLDEKNFDLIILDISMNISSGSLGPRGGHANLGGYEIAQRMYLLECETPTLVLTGFDYFRQTTGRPNRGDLISLDLLEEKIRNFLGEKLLGCVRYGSVSWRAQFKECIEKMGEAREDTNCS